MPDHPAREAKANQQRQVPRCTQYDLARRHITEIKHQVVVHAVVAAVSRRLDRHLSSLQERERRGHRGTLGKLLCSEPGVVGVAHTRTNWKKGSA